MKRLAITLIILWLPFLANAQVKGKVTDSGTNEPMPGVTVMVKNGSAATYTNADGSYTINAAAESVLQFIFMGYVTAEVTVGTQAIIDVALQPDTDMLEEVVVVGYGVQKKSDVTGAVTSLNNKALEERPNVNLIQTLQGAVAGLNISMLGSDAEGSESSTTIRGGNSITASNKPLIILDGIPFTGTWAEINHNDIESLEVLKDASSAAIYGARGANGVILIQSKKGKGEKVTVSYDGSITLSRAVNIPKMMDGETFYQRKLESGGDFTYTENIMHQEGRWTDWLDLALRNGFRQQHNVSFRGSTKNTSYYVSGNLANNKGISINDKFSRVTFRLNLEQTLLPWLKFGTNTSYGHYDRSGNKANFSKAYLMNPLSEAYDDKDNLRLQTWEDNNYSENPLNALNDKNNDKTDRIITNNYLDVTLPLKGLSYKLNTGYTYSTRLYQNYQGTDTYEGSKANGILAINNQYDRDWLVENIISYNNTFGKHTVFLTGLFSAQSELREANRIDAQDFPNDVMTYYQPDKGSVIKAAASQVKERHISQMFRANYSYDSRYLFTFTVRRDGFSAFGDDTKYGVFPSVAVGWNITNEAFIKGSAIENVLNNLKLRLSWGKNGNEAISAYSTLPSLSSKDYLTDDHMPAFGFYPSRLGSPALGWETTTSTNIGLDYGFLGNRVRGTLDVFFSNTRDLLLERSIPSINGASALLSNIGKTKSSGIELQVSSTNVVTENFTWNTDFNIVHYKTKIEDIGLYDDNGNPTDDIASGWFIGYPVNVNYDYIFDGIYQVGEVPENAPFNAQPGFIRYKDRDGDGNITPDKDKAIIGSREPKFTAGMNNTFRYKNLTLSVFVNASVGVTVPNYLLSVHTLSYRENQLDKEFWTPENPINTYPANVSDGSVNQGRMYFYRKADYLRIKDINLAYRIPNKITNKLKLERMEVYMNIKNLYTFTNWEGLDPEFTASGTGQRATPQVREFLFGLRFNF